MLNRLLLFIIILFSSVTSSKNAIPVAIVSAMQNNIGEKLVQEMYDAFWYKGFIRYEVFEKALKGYFEVNKKGEIENKRYLTIIDYSLNSSEKRFWLLDLEDINVLENSLVAHGKNSGEEMAVKFSNKPKSNMSSPGFFLTDNIYIGKHGASLRLDGIEDGINDNARKRAIVIHAASYVNNEYIKTAGRLGRSFGCPALPPDVCQTVIPLIKNKSLVYIFTDSPSYLLSTQIGEYSEF